MGAVSRSDDCDASQHGVVKSGCRRFPSQSDGGSHHTITLDCAGGSARIAGSHNDVTLTGGCTRLSIYGAWNKVTVAFATGARVGFVGAGNEVIWTTPDGKEPTALHLGVDNALKSASVQ